MQNNINAENSPLKQKIKATYLFVKKALKAQIKISKKTIVFQVISGIMMTIVPIITVYFPKVMVDMMTSGQKLISIIYAVAALIGIIFIAEVLNDYFSIKQSIYDMKLRNHYAIQIIIKMMGADYKNTEDSVFLDKQQKAFYSIGFIAFVGNTIFNSLLSSILRFILLFYILAQLDIVVIIFLTVIIYFNYKLNKKSMLKTKEIEDEKSPAKRKLDYNNSLILNFSGGKEIRIFNAFDYFLNKLRHNFSELLSFNKKQIIYTRKTNYYKGFLKSLQILILYGYIMYEFSKGLITPGDIILFITATDQLSSSMESIMGVFSQLYNSVIHYNSFKDFMDIPEEFKLTAKKDTVLLTAAAPLIEFKNVSFKYPNTDDYVLENVSIKINPYEKLSVVGDNGAGKTTFIKLLLRLYDVTNGEILINGINIKDYDYEEYISLFSPVFQDFKIFSFTIKENICFDDPNYSEDKLIYSIEKGNLAEKISSLPNNIDTYLFKDFVETGIDFSGGEKQRLAISRAFYKDAPVAVLDEPTASLDPIAEKEIYEQFNDMVEGKTAIYISHRMSSSKFCDNIAVFDNGKLAEYGTHIELMNLGRIYAEMYNKQAEYYI